MSDHTVSVLRRNVDGFPQAVCGCNWEGPPRRGLVPLVRAILDAQWHSTQSLHMPANPLVIDPYRPGRSPFGPVQRWGVRDLGTELRAAEKAASAAMFDVNHSLDSGMTDVQRGEVYRRYVVARQRVFDLHQEDLAARRSGKQHPFRRLAPWLWAAAAAVGIIAVGLNAPAEQDWPTEIAGNPDVTCQVTR